MISKILIQLLRESIDLHRLTKDLLTQYPKIFMKLVGYEDESKTQIKGFGDDDNKIVDRAYRFFLENPSHDQWSDVIKYLTIYKELFQRGKFIITVSDLKDEEWKQKLKSCTIYNELKKKWTNLTEDTKPTDLKFAVDLNNRNHIKTFDEFKIIVDHLYEKLKLSQDPKMQQKLKESKTIYVDKDISDELASQFIKNYKIKFVNKNGPISYTNIEKTKQQFPDSLNHLKTLVGYQGEIEVDKKDRKLEILNKLCEFLLEGKSVSTIKEYYLIYKRLVEKKLFAVERGEGENKKQHPLSLFNIKNFEEFHNIIDGLDNKYRIREELGMVSDEDRLDEDTVDIIEDLGNKVRLMGRDINKEDITYPDVNDPKFMEKVHDAVIVRTDNPLKSRLYGMGLSNWCTAQPVGHNHFYEYRFKDEETMYYIFFPNRHKKDHDDMSSAITFGIDTDDDISFADRDNPGDVTKHLTELYSLYPELDDVDLKKACVYVPFSKEELKIKDLSNELDVNTFGGLTDEEKEMYLQKNDVILKKPLWDILNAELRNLWLYVCERSGEIDIEILLSIIDKSGGKRILKNCVSQDVGKYIWKVPKESRDEFIGKIIDNVELDDNAISAIIGNSSDVDKMLTHYMNKGFQLNEYNVEDLISYSSDSQKTIDAILTKNVELTDFIVNQLINYSLDRDKTIDTILTKNVELNDDNIKNLIVYSSNKQKIIDTILTKNVELNDTSIGYLIYYSSDVDKMLTHYMNKGFKLNTINVRNLIDYSQDKQKIIDTILTKNVELNEDNIKNLIIYSSDKQKTIDTILNKNVELTDNNISYLILRSSDKQKTIDTILNKNVELNDTNITYLIDYSPDKQKTIDTLNKNVELNDTTISVIIGNSPDVDKMLTHYMNKGFELNNNVYKLIHYSSNKQKTIDTILTKNVELTNINVQNLIIYSSYSSNKQKTIDTILTKNVELTNSNIYNLIHHSSNKQKTIDTILSKLPENVYLSEDTVYRLITNSSDSQKTIDTILTKNVELTNRNVQNLIVYSSNKQKTIDTILTKNVELTDIIVQNLIIYSSNKQKIVNTIVSKLPENVELNDTSIGYLIYYSSDANKDAVIKKIDDLKQLKQQQQLKEEIRRIKSYRRLCKEQYREHVKYLCKEV